MIFGYTFNTLPHHHEMNGYELKQILQNVLVFISVVKYYGNSQSMFFFFFFKFVMPITFEKCRGY